MGSQRPNARGLLFAGTLGSKSYFQISAKHFVLRVQLDGRPVLGDGLVKFALSGKHSAPVVVGPGVLGFELDGLLILGDGLVARLP
jgi:hypothetical protein